MIWWQDSIQQQNYFFFLIILVISIKFISVKWVWYNKTIFFWHFWLQTTKIEQRKYFCNVWIWYLLYVHTYYLFLTPPHTDILSQTLSLPWSFLKFIFLKLINYCIIFKNHTTNTHQPQRNHYHICSVAVFNILHFLHTLFVHVFV